MYFTQLFVPIALIISIISASSASHLKVTRPLTRIKRTFFGLPSFGSGGGGGCCCDQSQGGVIEIPAELVAALSGRNRQVKKATLQKNGQPCDCNSSALRAKNKNASKVGPIRPNSRLVKSELTPSNGKTAKQRSGNSTPIKRCIRFLGLLIC